ncbi:MAG: chemotaxis protein CheW [bacterium]
MREDLRERLEAVRERMNKGSAISEEEKAEILRTRACELGREADRIERDEMHLEVVEFLLAHERYALELDYIREIYPLKTFTPLPCTPDYVLGIINIRGQILSIIDLKRFFGLPERGFTDVNRILILHSDAKEFGILADEIIGVRSIPTSDIQPSLPTLSGVQEKYLRGVTVERLVILSGERILSDQDIVVHEEME